MFDLETKIATWRESFARQKLDESTLAELESHLRDLFATLKRTEPSEQTAWDKAVESLGDAKRIVSEFHKAPPFVWWPTLFAIGLVTFAAAGAGALTLKRGVHGVTEVILLVHVITITLGYTAMFATGSLAICSTLQRIVKRWDVPREIAYSKYSLILSVVAAIAVAVGIILGSIWTYRTRHEFWNQDAREIGGAIVFPWALCQVEIFRRSGFSSAIRLCAGFMANAVTALAWFGPLLLESSHAYGIHRVAPEFAAWLTANSVMALIVGCFMPAVKNVDAESIKAD